MRTNIEIITSNDISFSLFCPNHRRFMCAFARASVPTGEVRGETAERANDAAGTSSHDDARAPR